MTRLAQGATHVEVSAPQRLLSLDVLRGIAVALMILVNNAGDGKVSYPQLRHSVWNGCTLTDIVFPTFLFMVGVSIALALSRRLAQNASRGGLLIQILKRSILILLIGLVLNALPFFQMNELRYYGVLQRIAICYALASLIYLYGGVLGSAVVAVLVLVGYSFLMLHVRVPGYGMPGVDVAILDPAGNLASWVDRALIPVAHLYHHTVYDPEGLLSTLPAVGTVLIGVLAASLLQSSYSATRKALLLFSGGALLIGFGLIWSHWFPLNKRLWTSSYSIFTAGIAMVMLAVLFWCIDGPAKLRRGLTPWLVFGTNALAAYVLSEVLAIVLGSITLSRGESLQQFFFQLLPHFLGPPATLSLFYSVLFVIVCAAPMLYLYRHKILIKL